MFCQVSDPGQIWRIFLTQTTMLIMTSGLIIAYNNNSNQPGSLREKAPLYFSRIAQLKEHWQFTPKVQGSNPDLDIFSLNWKIKARMIYLPTRIIVLKLVYYKGLLNFMDL